MFSQVYILTYIRTWFSDSLIHSLLIGKHKEITQENIQEQFKFILLIYIIIIVQNFPDKKATSI
jgi:hypothetical protein